MAYTTINKSGDYFNTKLYTGNGSTQTITGVGFQPDFMWIKERSGTSSHALMNAVSGINKKLMSNSDDVESTETNYITAVSNDGFSVGQNNGINQSGVTNVAWNWKANGAGSANTDGSISSTVSVNTTAGFSIVKWTGTGSASTVGHGLGVAPKMIIMKRTNGAVNDWVVYHESVGNNKALFLNVVNTPDTDSAYFNDTSPTSSVFSVKSSQTNNNGDNQIAFCFAEKTGYSKFGSYTGNGSSDGAFVYTGFKPAWLMIKRTDANANWSIVDVKRDTYNSAIRRLNADQSNAENTSLDPFVDILSNGFKLQASSTAFNGSGGSYIFMAFGQSIVGSNNIPATAR